MEAVKSADIKYICDINGNTPLSYILKRKNYEILNIMLDLFI